MKIIDQATKAAPNVSSGDLPSSRGIITAEIVDKTKIAIMKSHIDIKRLA